MPLITLPDFKCVKKVSRMCGEYALSRECVENVYLLDNRIFHFFLQLRRQFHPFLALSEPGNNHREFEEVVNWLEERAHCGYWEGFLMRMKERVKILPS
jgi:hypothetical protein